MTDAHTTFPPKRIQRKRTKGWSAPEGAIYVGRPTVWGNPFQVTCAQTENFRQQQVERYRGAICGGPLGDRIEFEKYIRDRGWKGGFDSSTPRTFLRGKTLMCWCREDQACHADVLLELANK